MAEDVAGQDLPQEYVLICQPQATSGDKGLVQSILMGENGDYKILPENQFLVKQEATGDEYDLLSEVSYTFNPCEQCYTQDDRSSLRLHLMAQHTVTLEQSIQLEGHILGNAPRPNEGRDQGRKVFTCHVCSKKFNQSCNLKTHMRIHTGERPFECPECGRFFTNKVNLQTHMRTHTGEKPFVCVVCSTQFTQVSSLKVHMRSHTGERPYLCRTCFRGFTKSSDLNRHMKTHLDQRPYKCRECQRGFTQMNSLQMHLRLHYNYRPYICFICDKRFARVSCLKAHTKLHTDLLVVEPSANQESTSGEVCNDHRKHEENADYLISQRRESDSTEARSKHKKM